jgi:hypothetical protein
MDYTELDIVFRLSLEATRQPNGRTGTRRNMDGTFNGTVNKRPPILHRMENIMKQKFAYIEHVATLNIIRCLISHLIHWTGSRFLITTWIYFDTANQCFMFRLRDFSWRAPMARIVNYIFEIWILPWSIVSQKGFPLELIVTQPVKEFSDFTLPRFCKIHFNTVFLSKPRFTSCLLPWGTRITNKTVYVFLTHYESLSSHRSWYRPSHR